LPEHAKPAWLKAIRALPPVWLLPPATGERFKGRDHCLKRLNGLPYLQACIKESLRHNPAATGLLPPVVSPNGDTHKGVYLPPGTEVAFCAWNIHRTNTKAYGDDAHVFRPERWLEASPERLAVMEEAFHLVFGFGRFRCMGENIAKIELNKMFFEMFRRFNWSLVDPIHPLTKNMNYGLFVQKGMWVRVTERE
jgi:cytochrome P450